MNLITRVRDRFFERIESEFKDWDNFSVKAIVNNQINYYFNTAQYVLSVD